MADPLSNGVPTLSKGVLTKEKMNEFRNTFFSDPKNILALNSVAKHDPLEICMSRSILETTNHIFTQKVDSEVKPTTNQKNSGRCWLFAALNVLRIPFSKQYQLEDFEFSQNYLFFWEKVERCNFFLHTIVEVLKRGEEVNGRLMSFLLHDPIGDGGQWAMVVNIIKKYGLMPKKCFPETYCCDTSSRLNTILKSKAREYTRNLDIMVKQGNSDEKLEEAIILYLEEMYRIIGICLSIPPEQFTWEHYNKNKLYCCVGPITPLKFYEEYVKPFCNIEEKVCIVNDARRSSLYGETYTVDCLGNVVGGHNITYLNLEIEKLMKFCVDSIKNNEAVWFGCDVGQRFAGKAGINDLNVHDYSVMFGTDVVMTMSKEDRIVYGESAMNHAMTLTGMTLNSDGEPVKWRVENSWGDDRGDKGYIVMTTEWFKEFVFEVVVDKQYVPKDILELLKKEPKVLPAWDPMGSVAT